MSCLPVSGAIPCHRQQPPSGQGDRTDCQPCDVRKPTVSYSGTTASHRRQVSKRRSLAPGSAWSRWVTHRKVMRGHPRQEAPARQRVDAWLSKQWRSSGHQPPDRSEQNERLPRRWVRKTERAGPVVPDVDGTDGENRHAWCETGRTPNAPADLMITRRTRRSNVGVWVVGHTNLEDAHDRGGRMHPVVKTARMSEASARTTL
jgi:hypothetical protein